MTKNRILGDSARVLIVACLTASSALAGKVIPKPAPHGFDPVLDAPEYSTSLARSGRYTLVAALQEHVKVPGEAVPTFPSIMQGAVYLMDGANTTPERLYQFPGVENFSLMAGSQVAIANRFLAFGTGGSYVDPPSAFSSSIFIVKKVNGSWGECGWVNNQRDCTNSVRENGATTSQPLTRIPLTYPGHYTDINIALTDNYLAIGYRRESAIEVYRYDSARDVWVLELSVKEPNERKTGTALAFDGDKLVVSLPWPEGPEFGTVRMYKRDAASGTWLVKGAVYGYFTSGRFGKSLAMADGRLVVASGSEGGTQHLSFFDVAADGTMSNRQTITTPTPLLNLAVSSDTLVGTTASGDEGLVIYKRAAGGTWGYENGLVGNYYQGVNGTPFGYRGYIDPIGLAGDELSLGWRGYGNLRGAFIAEKVSLIDSCREPRNLVSNCSFDNGSNTSVDAYPSGNGWQLFNWNGGSAWTDFNGRQLRINVQQPGYDFWHIQARTTVKLAQAGTYRLSFRAKADSYRSFVVNLGRNGSGDNNWTSYGRVSATAGPAWGAYSYEFTGVPQDAAAFLDLNVGNAGTAAITFDSVKLIRQ